MTPATAKDATFSIRTRLTVLAATFLAVVLIAAALAMVQVRRWEQTSSDRRAARMIANDLSDLRLAMSDQETGVRGYLLSDDTSFLDPYKEGRANATRAMSALRANQHVIRAFPMLLDQFERADQGWLVEAIEPALALQASGQPVPDALLDTGKREFDTVRSRLDTLTATLDAKVTMLDEANNHQQRVAVAAVFGGFLAALAGALVVLLLVRRWMSRPLADIAQAARSIGAGADGPPRPALQSAELVDVWSAIELLQQHLTQERDRAVRAYETLEQSAVLALHVRSELVAYEHLEVSDGWAVASRLRSAEGLVAGDCYDIGLINSNQLYVVVIDVTGHGPLAALNALKAKALLRSAVKAGHTPGGSLDLLQRQATDTGLDYLTAFIAVVNLRDGICHYANAGHPPAHIIGPNGSITHMLGTGPLVGPIDAHWETSLAEMDEGATLVVYTDGLTEATGNDRERIGEERVIAHLTSTEIPDADSAVDGLIHLFEAFHSGRQVDDITIVALSRGVTTHAEQSNDELASTP